MAGSQGSRLAMGGRKGREEDGPDDCQAEGKGVGQRGHPEGHGKTQMWFMRQTSRWPTSWLQPLILAPAVAGPGEPRQYVCLLLMLVGFHHFPMAAALLVSVVGRVSRGNHL